MKAIYLILLLLLSSFSMTSASDFETDIQPILEFRCVSCHNEDKAESGLRMDLGELFKKGGESGPAYSVENPDDSLLIELVTLPSDDPDIMPPKGKPLTETEINKLRAWIRNGALWPTKHALIAKNEADFKAPKTLPKNDKKIVKIETFPKDIILETKRDYQSVVVMATYDDDTTLDVTEYATFRFTDPSLVRLKTRNSFLPKADGQTELIVSVDKFTSKTPVTVVKSSKDRPISFHLDVMPVFMRENCNTGACHGSARGQDGFMLSLFGYDPKGDHFRLTREMAGRRINLAIPEESLLLEKSIEAVPHTGGKLFEKNSSSWKTILEWISDGANIDSSENAVPTVTALEISPPKIVLEGAGSTQQMTVRAKYSDGHDRDVTNLVVFMSSNDTAAKISEDGLVSAGSRGETFIMARFETKTVGVQCIVVPENLKYTQPKPVEANYIDPLIHDKLHKLRIIPSTDSTDEKFLRRVYLDLTGQLPTVKEYQKFINDDRPDKRTKLVDSLVRRPEFTDIWVMKWAELLNMRSSNLADGSLSYKSVYLYHQWLKDHISRNTPFDQIVVELLGASGSTFSNPATNFYQVEQDKLKLSENVAQVFMGIRLQCAQCHNHPFDRWTMDDYYGWAAFFAQVGRKSGIDPREKMIFDRSDGSVKHKIDGREMAPKFLGGDTPDVQDKDRRTVVGNWLASPENPYFAKNIVNIVWSHFFGIGIVEPVDDVRVSNPASNPELLDELAGKFQYEYKYDLRKLVAAICNSKAYQRSTKANSSNKDDQRNFAKARIRRQRAEILFDTITQVTETKSKFQGFPEGARAVQISDGKTSDYFLTTFGRSTRNTVCSCEVKMDPSLSQALHLMNGPTVSNKIQKGNVVKNYLNEGKSPKEIIELLYIRCLSRKPTETEANNLLDAVQQAGEDKKQQIEVLNDVFWAVLNSKEFLFNH